ncbi:MAG: RHS repeat-associated core domain-containing protein [Planctomycetaceae bacterium]|nr:RHS repeat-associated core domain-containing protein [Planctomycetaceae bacterium]
MLWSLGDHIGSIRDVVRYNPATNTTQVANHLFYDAFGNIVSESDVNLEHRFAFTGREWDEEIDLQYNRARYYAPQMGRWISKDPLGFDAGDMNLYRYVGNGPTDASDPSGLIDPKNVSSEFIEQLRANGAEQRYHLGDGNDRHATLSYRYVDPNTGTEQMAIFRDRTTTSWLLWSEKRWEMMGIAPLSNMSPQQAYDTIHDSPLDAHAYNESLKLLQAIPLVRTADSISQGKVAEAAVNFAWDISDGATFGGASRSKTVVDQGIKWVGRGALAGEAGLGTYEAYNDGNYARLQGVGLSLAMRGAASAGTGKPASPRTAPSTSQKTPTTEVSNANATQIDTRIHVGESLDLLDQRAMIDNPFEEVYTGANTRVAPISGPGKFSVGPYNEMKGVVPGLDAHHAGQSAAMKKVVAGYDHNTAPTILVPKVGHTIKGPNGIVSRSTKGLDNARDIVARDIKELRRVYPDVPNARLQELSEMNKRLYPEMSK